MRGLLVGLIVAVSAPALAAPAPNAFSDRMRGMSPVQRDAALRGAVAESGLRCGKLSGSAYVGPYKNVAMWRATCAPGGDVAIFVGNDGSIQARLCTQTKQLGLPACGVMAGAARRR